MKPVVSVKNQYKGINAHLHSRLQHESGWSGFHARHIVHLADALQVSLIPMGYIADVEQSLQIHRLNDVVNPRSDILISDTGQPHRESQLTSIPQQQTMSVMELFQETEVDETPYYAIAIYPRESRRQSGMQPVAWLELRSPTSKIDGEDARKYRSKRLDLLMSGLVFVEIDYLHETPPTFPALARYYPPEQRSAHPYHIIVIDPRPDFEQGTANPVGFNVDQAFPRVYIPLSNGDGLEFDFGEAYERTFMSGYYGYDLDYAELPVNFERYSPADQQRIAARMLAVLQAAAQGLDLEQGAFPAADIELTEALAQIAALKNRA